MKFSVLSLNPGIDRVLYLPEPMNAGHMNRAVRTVTSQGSKGANVALMLKRLGCDAEYYSFTGGTYGEIGRSFLERENVVSRCVTARCGIRVNTKVIDGAGICTELNERGGPFEKQETERLIGSFLDSGADVFFLCGSIPQGVEKAVYKEILACVHRMGKKAVLDCDGEALPLALEENPDIIKPNADELSALGQSTGMFEGFPQVLKTSVEKVTEACGKVRGNFGKSMTVICTMGGDGAVCSAPSGEYFQPAARVEMRGFSGAGDCFLSAFAAAKYGHGLSDGEALAYGTSCGGAKVMLEGTRLPEKDAVDALYARLTGSAKW